MSRVAEVVKGTMRTILLVANTVAIIAVVYAMIGLGYQSKAYSCYAWYCSPGGLLLGLFVGGVIALANASYVAWFAAPAAARFWRLIDLWLKAKEKELRDRAE